MKFDKQTLKLNYSALSSSAMRYIADFAAGPDVYFDASVIVDDTRGRAMN